jgi:hypothetical protein
MSTVVRLLSLAVGCLFLFIGVALVSPRLVPKLAGALRPVAKWVMFVGALFVYPIRIGTWLVRGALFGRGLGLGGRVLRFVGGFLLTLAVGAGILLAASWALGAALGKVLFYFGAAAVAVTEVALVIWLVIQVVKAVRGGGFASDLPEVRSDPATDRLSGENARRSPGRTAATAAALMIGLALVTFIAVLANG